MSRRLFGVAVAVSAVLLASWATPAAAAVPFGQPVTLAPSCGAGFGDASIAADGAVRGFAECNGDPDGPIRFFRHRPGVAPFGQATPYTGFVLATAWDGVDATYVVFQQGSLLRIGKRTESTNVYATPTTLATDAVNATFHTADVVASNGQWWAVWSEQVGPGGEFAQTELFQRHTLLGTQGRTRITTTAGNLDDFQPSLAYESGTLTLVWTRWDGPAVPGPADLRIGTSTGGAWTTRPLASAGTINTQPDVLVSAGVTYVTWVRDGRIVVATDASGSFASRQFTEPGSGPRIGLTAGRPFVGWAAGETDETNRVFLAVRTGGVWAGQFVTGAPAAPIAVLGQGSRARIVYRTAGDLKLRLES